MARPQDPDQPGYEIREAQERVAQQKALVRRRIVQGTPTQGLEDQLRHLEQALLRMKKQGKLAHPKSNGKCVVIDPVEPLPSVRSDAFWARRPGV